MYNAYCLIRKVQNHKIETFMRHISNHSLIFTKIQILANLKLTYEALKKLSVTFKFLATPEGF